MSKKAIVDFIPVQGGAPAVTWDPANKSSAITLSNGNLTATVNSSAGFTSGVRSTTSHSTGKYYFEVVQGNSNSAYNSVGIVDTSFVVGTTNNYDPHCESWMALGSMYNNGSSVGGWPAWQANSGKINSIAIDVGAKLIWGRVDGGAWYGSSSGGNPAAGTLGFSYGISGSVYAYVNEYTNTYSSTVNFGATSYSYTPPTGFGNW